MKILLAIDGSRYGEVAARKLIHRVWPPGTEVLVLSVAHPFRVIVDPLGYATAAYFEALRDEQERAARDVARVADEIKQAHPSLQVSTRVLEGSPKEQILEEAERWGAELIMMGSHGRGPVGRFLLGSVAQAVALHAPCSVEIVRSGRQTATN